jgi:hypothetical protein
MLIDDGIKSRSKAAWSSVLVVQFTAEIPFA